MAKDSPLIAVESLVAKGQRGPALERLLPLWRESRSRALAELIEKLSDEDLAAPVHATRSTGAHLAALRELVSRGADPRIATVFVGQLEKPRYTAQSGKPTWRLVFEQLGGEHADPRTVARLEPLIASYRFVFGATVMAEWMIGQMTRLRASLRERFPGVDPLAGDPVLARLLGPPAPAKEEKKAKKALTEEDFARDIAADPTADGPRLVFADWLLERGDPRGDFMTLQFRRHRGEALSPEDEKREAALVAKHAALWLGPLATCTDGWRFERGCLATCKLKGNKFDAQVVGHPLWATVHELSVGRRGKTSDRTPRDILMAPVLRRLRRLRDVTAVAMKAVVTASEPWASLELLEGCAYEPEYVAGDYGDPPAFPPGLWRPLVEGAALPALRSLSLTPRMHGRGQIAFTDFWSSPLVKRLEKLEIRYLRPWDVPNWYADFRERVRGLDLVIVCGPWIFRPRDGEPSELEITECGNPKAVAEALERVPGDALTSLTFTLSEPVAAQQATELERVCRRFTRLQSPVTIPTAG